MVNSGLNSASLLGICLMLFSIAFIPLGIALRRPFRIGNLIQDIIFAFVYLLCGSILVFQGWRLDPILQFGEFLLTLSSVYWVIKDMLHRSSAPRS